MRFLRSLIWRIWQYLLFLLRANSIYRIHSPFVYEFMSEIAYNKTPYYIFKSLAHYRDELSLNNSKLNIDDLGAGSSRSARKLRSVASILRTSVKRKKYAELLFRIAQRRLPENSIELGTSLGLTSIYLSKASASGKLVTIEGSHDLADFAKKGFNRFKCDNVEQIIGNFDTKLPQVLESFDRLDLAFIDGNHREEATLKYLKLIMNKTDRDSILVMDDIYWSPGMKKAWEKAKSMKEVSLSIDLFELGILFFFPRNQKEHFRFIY